MTKTKISKKKFIGNQPGEGWNRIGITEERYGSQWEVWGFSVQVGKWKNLKVISRKPVEQKANYRLAWNGERFADNRDMRLIREFKQGLESVIQDVLE